MPAAATTFPSGSSVPLPRKKPGSAGPAKSARSFFEKSFNVKRFLKKTSLKPVIEWYDRVEDPPGEIKKAVKLAVKDRILFSALGPRFREHPIYGVLEFTANAPKKVFNLVDGYVWEPNTHWGYEKHVVPSFTKGPKGQEEILKHFAQNQFQETDHLGHLILNNEKGERLKLAYDRRISFLGKAVPFTEGKGAIKNTTVWTPKAGAGKWRTLGTAVQVLKKGALGWGLSFINPLLAPLPILLDGRILSHLGWETQGGIYRDKIDLPLINGKNEHVTGLRVLTEDNREWLLPKGITSPADIRAKARVFTGRFAPILNRVSQAARGLYVAKGFLSLNPRDLQNFGWIKEIDGGIGKKGEIMASIAQRTGRLAQLSRSLFYLHPRNWINGEAFKKLGFIEKLVFGADGKMLLTKLNPRKGFEWAQYLYSFRHFFSRNPRNLSEFGWQRSKAVEGKLYIRPTRFAQFNRTLFYLHPRNWLYGNETWKRLGWPEYLAKGKFRRVARTIYELHPVTLWRNIKEGLPRNWRLLRISGLGGYLRLKRLDFDNWVSLTDNYLSGGLRRLRPGFRKFYQNLEGRYAKFVLFNPLVDRLRLRRRELGKAVGGLKNGLGKAGGAVKGWLLAAKKKSDELWKKLISVPLKFLFDLAMKALSKVAGLIWGKVGPLLSRFGGFISSHIPAGIKGFFAKAGAGIGESLVGKLMAKIGAQLAGRALLGVAARFIGNVLLKGAFEAFAWLTMPEIQILSYAWRGIQFLFSKTIGQLIAAGGRTVLSFLGERLLGAGVQATWRAVLGQVGSRLGGFLLQNAWRPLVGWVSGAVWPSVTGFFTATLPAWIAAAAEGIGAAIGALAASFLGTALLVTTAVLAVVFLFVVVVFKTAELGANPFVGEVAVTRLTVKNVVQVAVNDSDPGKGTNRLQNLDGKSHLVEFIVQLHNGGKVKAEAITLTPDLKMGTGCQTMTLTELGPGEDKVFDKCGLMVTADSNRTEAYSLTGSALIDGQPVNLNDVGILIIGAAIANAPPCGWPATGELVGVFGDQNGVFGAPGWCVYTGERKCSGDVINSAMYDPTGTASKLSVYSTIRGVVSRLYWGDEGGFMTVKSADSVTEVTFGHLEMASVVPDQGTGLTYLINGGQGLALGSAVNLGQYVADAHYGNIGHSLGLNVFYQVRENSDSKDPGSYPNTTVNTTCSEGYCFSMVTNLVAQGICPL